MSITLPRMPMTLARVYDTTREELVKLIGKREDLWVIDESTAAVIYSAKGMNKFQLAGDFTSLATTLHAQAAHGQLALIPVNHAGITAGWIVQFLGNSRAQVTFPMTLAVDKPDGLVAFPTVIFPAASLAAMAGVAHSADGSSVRLNLEDKLTWRVADPTWRVQPTPPVNTQANENAKVEQRRDYKKVAA
jgi:hypothetical protein